MNLHLNSNQLYDCDDKHAPTLAMLTDNGAAAGLGPLFVAAPELFHALSRILAAHDSGNNGAVMGEASLCPMFATMARAAIAKAKGKN